MIVTLDERAFAEAEERFRDTYRIAYREGSRWGDCEQAHHEATQEALEAFLGCYLEETGRCEGDEPEVETHRERRRPRWVCRIFGHRYRDPFLGRVVNFYISSAEGPSDGLPVGVCNCGARWEKRR